MEKKTRKKRNGKKRRDAHKGLFQRPGFIISVVAIVVVISFAAWGASLLLHRHSGPSKWIHIPGGASSQAVADSIRSVLGPAEGDRVVSMWKLLSSGQSASHGAYKVTDGQSLFSVARNISRGRQTPVRVTWNNVRTIQELAEAVARNMEFSPEDFLLACDERLKPEGFSMPTYPAAFLPDTYEFYWTTQAVDVVDKLYSYSKDFWSDERVAAARKLGLDPVQVATVASIVEEETGKADERGAVARLYINRLQSGMPLQADPTVKFAIGDFSIRRITNEMLRTESPYNTYRVKGLPPGPIRIPSKNTLEAVLSAPEHDYLYMCAREDFSGYHNFSRDYNTHLDNARRYQAELNRRNIH